MIDIHSHLLPAIDDGSRSPEQSVGVLNVLAGEGVRAIVLTPHVRASDIAVDLDDAIERRDVAYTLLQEAQSDGPALHLGFEIMIDDPIPTEALKDRRFALAGSRYYLVEFPLTVVADFARRALEDIVRGGAVPVVAHPERYSCCSPQAVTSWRDVGAKIQVDSTTLTRPTTRGHRARELLSEGLADVIAGDNHGDRRSVLTGVEYLVKRDAEVPAWHLSTKNPGAIVEDRELSPVPPAPLKESLFERWQRFAKG